MTKKTEEPKETAPEYTGGPEDILRALHEVMGKVGYVKKGGENKFHKYKYAGEGDLLEVLRPAMVEAGLLLLPSQRMVSDVDQHGNVAVQIEYTLAHVGGAVWPEKIFAYGCGNDRNSKGGVGDKGLYKALTGANKYLLFKLFQIQTGDDPEQDSDHEKEGEPKASDLKDIQPDRGDNPQPTGGFQGTATEKQKKAIKTISTKLGVSRDTLEGWAGMNLRELTKAGASKVMDNLKALEDEINSLGKDVTAGQKDVPL